MLNKYWTSISSNFFCCSIEEVRGHLEDYLRRAGGLTEKRDHMIEVGVLCVQCMEVSIINILYYFRKE